MSISHIFPLMTVTKILTAHGLTLFDVEGTLDPRRLIENLRSPY